jgi:hypothetical protein
MMIIIAVAGALVTYAWVMGYLSFTTTKAGRAMRIQSIANSGDNLLVYVQNVGVGTVQLDPTWAAIVFINGTLYPCSDVNPADGLFDQGQIATLTVAGAATGPGEMYHIKVVSIGGTFTEATSYPQDRPDAIHSPLNSSRIGWWLQVTSIATIYTVETFTTHYFDHYTSVELMVPLNRLDDYGTWVIGVGDWLVNHPNIEATLYLWWDMEHEADWSELTTFLNELDGFTNVGCDGEHMVNPSINGYERASLVVSAQSFRFVCYYSDDWDPTRQFFHIHHTPFPTFGYPYTWTEHQPGDLGTSAGMYAERPFGDHSTPLDPNDYFEDGEVLWNQFVVEAYVEAMVGLNRSVYIHLCGILDESFTGVSGVLTNHLWDHPVVHEWITSIRSQYSELM